MIKSGLKKREVEARLQKENKIEGEINIYQWKRLSASRNQPQEIMATQQYRTKKNLSTEGFKAECVKIFREKSQNSELGVDGLMQIFQQVQRLEKYAANSEVQKLLISRRFAENVAKNNGLIG